MDIYYACVIAAVLCFIEARNCTKRAKLWGAIADLEERIEKTKKDTTNDKD